MKAKTPQQCTLLALATLALAGSLCPIWARADTLVSNDEEQQLEEVAPDEAAPEGETPEITDSEPAEPIAMVLTSTGTAIGSTVADETTAAVSAGAASASDSILDSEVTIPNGVYTIQSAAGSSQALDIENGSAAAGAAVQLYAANGTPAQRYRITRNAAAGTYTIVSVNSGLPLGVAGASRARGAAIRQLSPDGGAAQQWRAYDAGDGAVYLASQLVTQDGEALVLDVPGGKAVSGAKMRTSTANGTAAQRFRLSEVTRTVGDGTYEVVSRLGSDLLLDVSGGSRADGGNVWAWGRNGTPAQWWRVAYNAATGYYQLVNCNSEKPLDLAGSGGARGANVQIGAAVAGRRGQAWSIEEASGGGYVLRSAASGRVADVAGGRRAPGTNVRLWDANGSAAQAWTFEAPTMGGVASGSYQIVSVGNMTLCLDVDGGRTANGSNVRLWSLNDSNAQKWKVGEADGSGWRVIVAAHSDTYLSVDGSGNICLSTGMSGDSEKWKIQPATLGYELVNKATGKVADVAGGNIARGTNVRAYKANKTVAQGFMLVKTTVKKPAITTGTFIMGKSEVTQAQAVRYLKTYFANRGISLPSKWVKDGETIEKLVKYFYEEGEAEGVRGDVALAQSIHETGYFQFGNLVQPEQYNFAGLGATGQGVHGEIFKTARIGIRAQIQHLKAYASTEPLNKAVVDTRFGYVPRGCAPTVGSLGGKWAVPGVGYGQMIVDIMNAMRAS